MRRVAWVPSSLVVMTSAACGDVTPPPTERPPPAAAGWEAFTLGQLRLQRAQQNVSFLEFLSKPSLRMGLYHLPVGTADGQSPHGEDEVYVVMAGVGVLSIDGVDHPVEEGSAVFVRAGVPHHFHSVTETLDVLVVFASAPSDSSDPGGLTWLPAEILAGKDPTRNVWDPFLQVSTMSLGVYMLPAAVGGDAELTHAFDEINIVLQGTGRLQAGDDAVAVGPGSIVFVPEGLGHRFRELSADLDVLILWER